MDIYVALFNAVNSTSLLNMDLDDHRDQIWVLELVSTRERLSSRDARRWKLDSLHVRELWRILGAKSGI